MIRTPCPRLAAAILLLAAGGCVAPTPNPRYPSLLPRSIEARSDAEPEAAPLVTAADPATDATIAALHTKLAAAGAAFAASATTADRSAAAAAGDAVGGERWIAAQGALAQLDGLHATTSAILSEIDDIALARASAGQPPYPALEALRDDAQSAVDAEATRIAKIQASLPSA